jgi:hypothetical protein
MSMNTPRPGETPETPRPAWLDDDENEVQGTWNDDGTFTPFPGWEPGDDTELTEWDWSKGPPPTAREK